MAYAPKNDGRPNTKFYESADILSLFEGVKTWLMKNAKKVWCICWFDVKKARDKCAKFAANFYFVLSALFTYTTYFKHKLC